MKNKGIKREAILDPVEQAEHWKDSVDKEIAGMSETKLNRLYNRDMKAVIHKYHIKEKKVI